MASGKNGFRQREFAFGSDPFMLFGDVLDAVAWVAGISVRSRNEMTNFIGTWGRRSKHPRFELNYLTYTEFMSQEVLPSSYWV
jgi:hypothetical protein